MRRTVCCLVLVLLSGCAAEGARDDQAVARGGLLRVADLPRGAVEIEASLDESRCGLVARLRGRATAISPTRAFDFQGFQLLQSVGVFSTERAAVRAFERISSLRNQACIATEMRRDSGRVIGVPASTRSVRLDVTLARARAQAARFEVVVRGEREPAYVDALAVQRGRAVSIVAVGSRLYPLGGPLRRTIARRVRSALAAAR